VIAPGDVISYIEMCQEESASLQRGMNFRLRANTSVILMSLRPGAPYADRIEDDGKTLVYEGHDLARRKGGPNPKRVDQPRTLPSGKPTQNGLFFDAAARAKRGESPAELVKVYEKIRNGVWAYAGVFELLDARQEVSGRRKVFKFKLVPSTRAISSDAAQLQDLPHNRLIPTAVKVEVWKRDKGKCVLCGRKDNLHFDHDIPYSQGGSSLLAKNIQLLCARHNLQKHDKIL
jgi:HNH endonuclease